MAGMTTGGGPGGLGGVPRSGDDGDPEWAAEELLPDEAPEEGEPIGEDALASLPDAANEADVVEQHIAVVGDDDDLDRVSEDLEA